MSGDGRSGVIAPPSGVTIFARGPLQAGGVVILEPEEAHHLKVRRIGDGAQIRLVDGKGGVATARLSVEGDAAQARVVATTTVAPPPLTELFVGAGDKDRFISLVEKATELGATRVVPIVTERVLGVATRFGATHVDKALKKAREAVKQCGGTWTPTVLTPVPLAEALRTPAPTGVRRFLADPDGVALPHLKESDGAQWAIGPEGGFTDAEIAAFKAAGFAPVALGRSLLRFDTAAVAALAVTAQSRLG